MPFPLGTLVNAAAVVVGSLIGLLIRQNLPEKIKAIFFQASGLVTLLLGVQMALKVEDILLVVFSMLIGAVLGEWLGLERLLERFGDLLKDRFSSKNENRFTEGMVTAFLVYCIGSLTIVGAINEGLLGDRTLLYTKSILDGFTSIAFASIYGTGVLFSVLPLLIFQGGLTFLAVFFSPFFTSLMISQLTAVGGLLIVGIGFNLLEIKKIKVINLLPALVVVAILTAVFH